MGQDRSPPPLLGEGCFSYYTISYSPFWASAQCSRAALHCVLLTPFICPHGHNLKYDTWYSCMYVSQQASFLLQTFLLSSGSKKLSAGYVQTRSNVFKIEIISLSTAPPPPFLLWSLLSRFMASINKQAKEKRDHTCLLPLNDFTMDSPLPCPPTSPTPRAGPHSFVTEFCLLNSTQNLSLHFPAFSFSF